jgi:hypothetical protein
MMLHPTAVMTRWYQLPLDTPPVTVVLLNWVQEFVSRPKNKAPPVDIPM